MSRLRFAGVVFSLIGPFLWAAAARADITVDVAPACGGAGIQGLLSDGLNEVTFEACATATGAYATLWGSGGQEMTDFRVDGQDVRYSIKRIGIDENTSEEDLQKTAEVFSDPLADPAGRYLWQKLNEAGYTIERYSVLMAALAGNLTGFEYLPLRQAECLGCCGYECSGCTGCDTQLCLRHDLLCQECGRRIEGPHPVCVLASSRGGLRVGMQI